MRFLRRLAPSINAMSAALALVGCATGSGSFTDSRAGESVVFVGDEPSALASSPLRSPAPVVRSSYRVVTNTITYIEGRDYTVDYLSGTLRRVPGSRLPDFRNNKLYGQENFDHSKFPGFGNAGYFAFVDYTARATNHWPIQLSQREFLPKTLAKLQAGQDVKIVAFGDSITAGGDATSPDLIFWWRWSAELQNKYPRARVTAVNGATGGDSTVQGLQRLKAKVIDQSPDLVLIGFGMNDHNRAGVPTAQFEANLKEMIGRLRAANDAEIILFSAFPPNPKWTFGSHHMEDYAAATERAARDAACAYADVFHNWQAIAAHKRPEDLLGNNINHPNDFGHWIYFRVLSETGL